jgi:hypothetical protein
LLTAADIERMKQWTGIMVVSGACASVTLAPAFLSAGATTVIAPERDVPWHNLGRFFADLYGRLHGGDAIEQALLAATAPFPELSSYRCFRLER